MRDRILVTHFLRGLLDNDLVSPDADRHQVLTVGTAALLSVSLFVTVLLGRYVAMPFQSPGRTALLAIDDRFFYAGLATIVLALLAVVEWDALALDARDASALAPLPIPHGAIVRAKLAAVSVFGGAFALALNGIPSLLHPMLMIGQLPADWSLVPPLVAAHAAATIGAGAFGFCVVFALREVARALLGERWFSKGAPVLQAGLVLGLVVLLLLLPVLIADTSERVRNGERLTPLSSVLFAHAGLHERLTGRIMERLPHDPLPPRVVGLEAEAMALYRQQRPALERLGSLAVPMTAAAVAAAVLAFLWNSRRLPAPPFARSPRRRRGVRSAIAWSARRLVVRRPAAQAGYFFTLQVLSRSAPHRVALAVSLAVGVAIATFTLRGVDIEPAGGIRSAPTTLLMLQTLLLSALLAGMRHAVRVPAELRATWVVRLAFSGDERPYLAGVKRATFVGAALPVLLLLLPLHALVLGTATASIHAAWGALLAVILADLSLMGFQKLPFAAAYVPAGQVNPLRLLFVPIGLGAAYALAWIEEAAIGAGRTAAFLASAGAAAAALHALDWWQRRSRAAMDLDEGPATATQRLGLVE